MRNPNPMQCFRKWFYEVRDGFPEIEVNAMNLITKGTDNFPKSRMVLLKEYNWEGFVFYTQYTSEKGKSMEMCPRASLIFPWDKAAKLVTVIGTVEKISEDLSKNYFDSRPDESKIGAWASRQSDFISSREALENQYRIFKEKFANSTVPKPKRWGGYLIRPTQIVFERRDQGVICKEVYQLMDDIDWDVETFFSFYDT